MAEPPLLAAFLSLPKAELHLHLEGSIEPATVCVLAARQGAAVNKAEARRRYTCRNFAEFIEAFKWVTSYLRTPEDYALITRELAGRLIAQNVVYAEVTLSVGVMLLRQQDVEANFEAVCAAGEEFRRKGLRLAWIFDAVRQFGSEAAMRVAQLAAKHRPAGVVAFGIGGDELSVSSVEFRRVYDYAAQQGLHRLIHAGEIGGSGQVRDAVELLGVERIGHGIAATHDPALLDLLAERRIPLEICPTSNLLTGALARLRGRDDVGILDHPLPQLLRHGVPVVLSTDDPAMFQITLVEEYRRARAMGLTDAELTHLSVMSFMHAFLSAGERHTLAASGKAGNS